MKKLSSPRATVLVAVLTVAAIAVLAADPAEARSRRGSRGLVAVRAPVFYAYTGFYGYYPYYGYPYYYGHPYAYRGPEGGVDRNLARLQGWGAVDVNVKPKKAEVWVDGRYVGKAGDFDGLPSYLWLDEGVHRVVIYKGGYQSYDEEIAITAGLVINLKLRLQPGESEPPRKE